MYKTRLDWLGKVIHRDYARKRNLTIRTNGICTIQNLSWRMTRPGLIIINENERTCRVEDFAVPVDLRVKLKKCKNRDKYLDLERELKNC